MIIDTNSLHLSDDQIRDLMIFYASKLKDYEFMKLYKELYEDATNHEIIRCAYFIRLALGISNNYCNY